MRTREKAYGCSVCQWQGALEPLDVGDAAPCPNCGVYLYPLSFAQAWGFALAIIAVTVVAVLVVAFLLTRN